MSVDHQKETPVARWKVAPQTIMPTRRNLLALFARLLHRLYDQVATLVAHSRVEHDVYLLRFKVVKEVFHTFTERGAFVDLVPHRESYRGHFTCWNTKSVIASNGLATTQACCPSLLLSKNEIWPLTIANFILVSEKSASKIQICSRKPLSGGLHDLFIRSFTRSCSAVFGSG